MKPAVLFFLLFCLLQSRAQVVNIENKRFATDTTGWKGGVKLGFSMGKQDKRYFTLNTTAHLQYKSRRSLYLLLGSYDLQKAQDREYLNGGFGHFRYNYKIRDWVRWEMFTQAQFNRLLSLRLRFLAGAGPRFKLCQVEQFKAYMGYLYMFEYEENTGRTEKLVQHRANLYLSLGFQPNEVLEFSSTTYYQPLLRSMSDYRVASENSLVFRINRLLRYELQFVLNYDSRPPLGAPTNFIYSWVNTFRIDIN